MFLYPAAMGGAILIAAIANRRAPDIPIWTAVTAVVLMLERRNR